MSQTLRTFTLDEAVLSGTEIAEAGGGLPRRIIPAGTTNLLENLPFTSDLSNIGSRGDWVFTDVYANLDWSTDPGWMYVTPSSWPLYSPGSAWPVNEAWTCSIEFKHYAGANGVLMGVTYDANFGPEIWVVDMGDGTTSLAIVFGGGGYGWYQANYLAVTQGVGHTVSLSYDGVGANINAWTMVIDGVTVDWSQAVEAAPFVGLGGQDTQGLSLGRRRFGDYAATFSFRNLTFSQTLIAAGSASWSFTPAQATTLRSIIMPGLMSNTMSASIAGATFGSQDFQINCPDLSASMIGETHTLSMVVNPGEYIATPDGGGPAVVYDATGRARIRFRSV